MKQKVKLSKVYKIDSLKILLSKYSSFKQCLRDIKIAALIGQRSKYNIEDINPPILITIDDTKVHITSLSIIIEVDQTISEIKIGFDIIGKYKNYMYVLFEKDIIDIIPSTKKNIILVKRNFATVTTDEFITGFKIKLKEIKSELNF